MNRKKRISILLLISLLVTCLAGCGTSAPVDEAAVTVLKNGTVLTVDGADWEKNTAQAVVYDSTGTILFVGSDTDAEQYEADAAEVIDLGGKVIAPGFIDTHSHSPGTAITELFEIYLFESISKEQTLSDIKAFIDANPDLDEYWGTGYTVSIGGDPKGPKAEWLDEICSDKPIILTSNDGHNLWLNTIALEMNGITKDTPVPAGGAIPKDPVTGELWGTLTDTPELITMETTYTDEQQMEAIKYWQNSMNAWGYTSVMCIYPHSVNTETYLAFEANGDLTTRLNIAAGAEPGDDFDKTLADAVKLREAFASSDLMEVTTMKYFADGVVEGMTAYLNEPYAPGAQMPADYVSSFYWDVEELKNYFASTMKEGFQIHVHSIGDAATDNVISALEYAQSENKDVEARNVITHLQIVSDTAKASLGQLNIIGSTQPFWHFKEPDWFDFVDGPSLGEERAWSEYPVKSLIDNNVKITFSGDYPVSPINNPFWAIETAVTRNLNNAEYYGVEDITNKDDPTYLLNPEERITPAQALEAYTINGAYQLYRENEVGSLKPGKKADLVILSDNLLTIDPLKIDSIKVLATVFDGKLVQGELK